MLGDEWKSLTEPEIAEFLAIIGRQSTHLTMLVDDLLTLSHLETGRLRLHLGIANLKQATEEAVAVSDSLREALVCAGPVHLKRRIFRFWDRSNRDGSRVRGYGMGLAIARHLAQAMVGDLTYRPHEPAGSEFVLSLPLGPPDITSRKEPIAAHNGVA